MKNRIEIPRHPDMGITLTIVVDMGKSDKYVMKQDIITDYLVGKVNFMDEVLLEYFKKNSHEIVEYMKEKGFIKVNN